jgi:Enoyl-(Acyl carrier protein) reductase
VKAVAERFGRLDILVNNAGIFSGGSVEEVTDDNYDRAFAVNVKSVFAAVREAAHHLKEGGRIGDFSKILLPMVPMNCYGHEVANLALFLASEEASYIYGGGPQYRRRHGSQGRRSGPESLT